MFLTPTRYAALVLDLDQCSFYGQDSNDLSQILQMQGAGYKELKQLADLTQNPCVADAYYRLAQACPTIKVVMYSSRAGVVHLKDFAFSQPALAATTKAATTDDVAAYKAAPETATNEVKIQPKWPAEWLKQDDTHLYFPAHLKDANEVMLAAYKPLRLDSMPLGTICKMRNALARIFALRDSLTTSMKLDASPPQVVITQARKKNVCSVLSTLGLASASLKQMYDDRADYADVTHLTVVPEFNAMSRLQRDKVLDFMERTVPAATLTETTLEWLKGAGAGHRAVAFEEEEAALGSVGSAVANGQANEEEGPKKRAGGGLSESKRKVRYIVNAPPEEESFPLPWPMPLFTC